MGKKRIDPQTQKVRLKEAVKGSHGGARPGAGRKPLPADLASVRLNKQLVARAEYVARLRDISVIQYLEDRLSPIVDADFMEASRDLLERGDGPMQASPVGLTSTERAGIRAGVHAKAKERAREIIGEALAIAPGDSAGRKEGVTAARTLFTEFARSTIKAIQMDEQMSESLMAEYQKGFEEALAELEDIQPTVAPLKSDFTPILAGLLNETGDLFGDGGRVAITPKQRRQLIEEASRMAVESMEKLARKYLEDHAAHPEMREGLIGRARQVVLEEIQRFIQPARLDYSLKTTLMAACTKKVDQVADRYLKDNG